ncbi:hypothetical protein MASR1M60_14630 [Rhodocyclaceae bacterium]
MLNADLQTLFFAAVVTSFILALALSLSGCGAGMEPLRPWATGLYLHVLMYLLLALRGSIPDLFSIVVANTAESIFVALWAFAIAQFSGRPLPRAWLVLPPLMTALSFTLLIDHTLPRILIGNTIVVVQIGLMLYQLQGLSQSRTRRGINLLIVSLAVTAILILLRMLMLATGMIEYVGLRTPGVIQTLLFLTGTVIPVVGSLGFLFMLNERASERIAESEARFRTIYDAINDAIFVHDATTARILDVNLRAELMYGHRREQLLTLDVSHVSANVPPYTLKEAGEFIEVCKKQGWHAFEWLARDSQDRIFWVAVNLQMIELDGKSCVLAVVRNIDKSKRIEEELRAALRVIEASPVVSYRLIPEAEGGWAVDYVSANISRWGYQVADLLAGQPPLAELLHPDDQARVYAELADFDASDIEDVVQEYRMRSVGGAYFWVEDRMHISRASDGTVLAYEGLIIDVDAKKQAIQQLQETLAAQRVLNDKLEEAHNQLLQSEKMASIGQLAAGVAHELNNPIGFVHSNLGTLKTYVDDIFQIATVCEVAAQQAANPDGFARIQAIKREKDFDFLKTDIYQLLNESVDGLQRVKKIVQDLKDFSRPGEAEWQWADLNQGIESTLNIVWNELKYKCAITKQYGDLPRVHCLIAQLNQVFMNLLVNAAQAIEHQGEITIATRALDAATVEVRISDTGKGIKPEHLNRLFDPFFTTKPVGKGTGLGLSIAWGIIEKHHGKIEVASEVGKGTTFIITLPVEPVDPVSGENKA